MGSELNKAHNDALELLKIVDDFCRSENIVYTLSGQTLIELGHLDFSKCYPTISIAVEYEGFKKISEYLQGYCSEKDGYSYHDHTNTEQFYSPDIWFVKHSRVKLIPERQSEEFYYGTHLCVTPLFYAGDSVSEWKRTRDFYVNTILPLRFRAMLKKKPVFTWLRQVPRRIRTRKFLKKRDYSALGENLAKLASTPKSDYIFFPANSTRGHGIGTSPDILPGKSAQLTYSAFWSKVERIDFYGVKCYCVKDREKLISLFPDQLVEQIRRPHKSQLLLNGGEEVRRIQLIQIELLTEFDRICRKHGLKYNINFGTLIGAMRHKGFIPWDDDIDVTMYYEDCDKLYEIMKQELDNEKYFYRCPQTELYHHIIFNHLEHRGTTFTKAGRDKLQNKIGVFIDIFPMYPAAPNAFVDFFHTRVCRFWRSALWSTVGADSEKNPVKRFYYRQTAKLGTEKCRRNFLKHATCFNNRQGRLKFWTSVDRSPYNVDLVRRDNFDEAIEVEFEGHRFFAPKHWEGTLEFCFSTDWRLYPNVYDRMPTHDAMIDIGDLYSYDNNGEKE